MGQLLQEMRFAARFLWRDRGYSATVLVTLAVCLAANAAIFTLVESVILRPLPVPEADRIVLLVNAYPKAGVPRAATAVPDYFDRLRETDVFEEQALFNRRGHTLGTAEGAERVQGMMVTPSFFRLLRVQAWRGRTFAEDEGVEGNDRKVVLSHALWQRLFGSDEGAVGREIRLNGETYTVVGIMPAGFVFVDGEVRLWLPLAFTAEQRSDDSRHSNNFTMLGRLKPGATVAQVQQQIDALNARNLERYPSFRQILIDAGFRTDAFVFQDDLVRDVRPILYLLWGGVLFVLAIGGVNVTNLALVRSSARVKELATRCALGADRGRLGRQLLVESVLLTAAGGVLGLLLGHLALQAIGYLGLDELPRGADIAMDGTVVVLVLGLSAAIGLVLGLVPLTHVRSLDLGVVLRAEGRGGTASRRARAVRRALVTAEVAAAFVLLVGAGLLLASFRQVLNVSPGFDPQDVVVARLSLPEVRYADEAALRSFEARVLERMRALPGVTQAALASNVPFGGNYSDSVILPEGHTAKPGESLISPSRLVVSDGYFETLRIPLRRGRFFTPADTVESMRAVIVDERLAAVFWPGEDAVGKRLFQPTNPDDIFDPGPNPQWLTVVGVVGAVRERGLVGGDERIGAYYFPYAQQGLRSMQATLRVGPDTAPAVIGALRREIAQLDPDLPVYGVSSMVELMDRSLASRRTPMYVALAFAAVALFLSAVGIYGMLAYQVTQRRREIGIRLALGGSAGSVFRLVSGEGLWVTGTGLVLGLAGAMALGHAMRSLLYGVRPFEPLVLTLVIASLASVATLATLVPARRATRVDPTIALASE